jgi:hypothetical protein
VADNSRGPEELKAESALLLRRLEDIRQQRLERAAATLESIWTTAINFENAL